MRVLGLESAAKTMGTLHTSTGWRPPLPVGFGVEQMVRAVGARANVPEGFDQWELWPNDTLLRANLASEAYQLGHLSPWAVAAAQAKTAVVSAMPTWTPLKRAVLGFALRYAGAPYVWGGTSPNPQVEFGAHVAGGFDCSGFVWWVMKMQTYTAGGLTWSGNAAIGQLRTTYQMAQSVPARKPRLARRPAPGRHPLLELGAERRAHIVADDLPHRHLPRATTGRSTATAPATASRSTTWARAPAGTTTRSRSAGASCRCTSSRGARRTACV